MRVLFGILAGLAGAIGLLLLFSGVTAPGGYALATASAPQIAQIYSQATYTLALGVAFLVLAAIGTTLARSTGAPPAPPRPAYACPRCHAPAVAGQRFCAHCGQDFAPAPVAAPAVPAPPEPALAQEGTTA